LPVDEGGLSRGMTQKYGIGLIFMSQKSLIGYSKTFLVIRIPKKLGYNK